MTLINNTARLMVAPLVGLAYAELLPFMGPATLISGGAGRPVNRHTNTIQYLNSIRLKPTCDATARTH